MKGRGASIDDRPGKALEYDEAFVHDLSLHQPLDAFLNGKEIDWREHSRHDRPGEHRQVKLVPRPRWRFFFAHSKPDRDGDPL